MITYDIADDHRREAGWTQVGQALHPARSTAVSVRMIGPSAHLAARRP